MRRDVERTPAGLSGTLALSLQASYSLLWLVCFSIFIHKMDVGGDAGVQGVLRTTKKLHKGPRQSGEDTH